ncbi:hypothetical protein D621_14885 [beta proteobacterium AAP51]|nr:hypothetical protein D621_14885 [beta proteobacterium AAP51]
MTDTLVLVPAMVTQVMLAVGIAYLETPDGRSWAVRRATRGAGLDGLMSGQLVALTIERHKGFDIAVAYGALRD